MQRRTVSTAVLVAFLAVAGCSGSGRIETAGKKSAAPVVTEPPVNAGATSASMCIANYSTEKLKEREFAFDGTLTAIHAPEHPETESAKATFDVKEWFKGGTAKTVTLESSVFGNGGVSPEGVTASVGDRMLVSGDAGTVWECGFTSRYDANLAAEWKAAFS